ncbi:hypothetical protein GW846_02490 [Candidatus Gracilibacteria bacterium]|nr:hypothetical protein [Candidatus Gracilibacteria bacterium]
MKKFLTSIFLSVFILQSTGSVIQVFAEEVDQNYFIVTAYYSPLPDQNNYLTGNFKDEVILNGQGIAGASGKKVFSGMLAAPSKYSFGTKIHLDGLGIGEVSDRGGAIVPAGQRGYSYDRIDIWMGYGDEGLKRALYWGKRKVAGNIVDATSSVNLDYTSVPSPNWISVGKDDISNKSVQQSVLEPVEQNVSIFEIVLSSLNSGNYVAELQTLLSDLGYIASDYTAGVYDDKTIEAVRSFQLNFGVISHINDAGNGVYGPKTQKEFKRQYDIYLKEQKLFQEYEESLELLQQEAQLNAQETIKNITNVGYGEISSSVREFQIVLSNLGYFDYKDTAIFGAKTKSSLIDYQLENNIIDKQSQVDAGIIGPKTLESLTEDIADTYFIQKLIEQNSLNGYISYVKKENKKIALELEQRKNSQEQISNNTIENTPIIKKI